MRRSAIRDFGRPSASAPPPPRASSSRASASRCSRPALAPDLGVVDAGRPRLLDPSRELVALGARWTHTHEPRPPSLRRRYCLLLASVPSEGVGRGDEVEASAMDGVRARRAGRAARALAAVTARSAVAGVIIACDNGFRDASQPQRGHDRRASRLAGRVTFAYPEGGAALHNAAVRDVEPQPDVVRADRPAGNARSSRRRHCRCASTRPRLGGLLRLRDARDV